MKHVSATSTPSGQKTSYGIKSLAFVCSLQLEYLLQNKTKHIWNTQLKCRTKNKLSYWVFASPLPWMAIVRSSHAVWTLVIPWFQSDMSPWHIVSTTGLFIPPHGLMPHQGGFRSGAYPDFVNLLRFCLFHLFFCVCDFCNFTVGHTVK